jgi:tellurite methyltransferase
MTDPRHCWESRHLESAAQPPSPPSAFLKQSFPLLSQTRAKESPGPHSGSVALDLACGAGQNSVWLAERGWPAVAADFSAAALDRAAALAEAKGIRTARASLDRLPRRFEGILLAEANLETCNLPESAFDLILCFHYLDRNAFGRIERAMAPGGFLLYETFTEAQGAFREGPHSPDHLLRAGELRHAFPGLETLFYREWCAGRALAGLLARK